MFHNNQNLLLPMRRWNFQIQQDKDKYIGNENRLFLLGQVHQRKAQTLVLLHVQNFKKSAFRLILYKQPLLLSPVHNHLMLVKVKTYNQASPVQLSQPLLFLLLGSVHDHLMLVKVKSYNEAYPVQLSQPPLFLLLLLSPVHDHLMLVKVNSYNTNNPVPPQVHLEKLQVQATNQVNPQTKQATNQVNPQTKQATNQVNPYTKQVMNQVNPYTKQDYQ